MVNKTEKNSIIITIETNKYSRTMEIDSDYFPENYETRGLSIHEKMLIHLKKLVEKEK